LKETELRRSMESIPKAFFTLSDLEKITGLDRRSLSVSLNRLVNRGVLVNIRRNSYILADEPVRLEAIAGQIYFPSYLSFESALSRSGVLNLVPYSLVFATVRKTRSMTILERRVEYRHLKENLYFGFREGDGFYMAEPEKALLDLLYLASFGKARVPYEELDLKSLSAKTLDKYVVRFPPRVGEALERLR